MANITPNGTIWICTDVPLSPAYTHSIYFPTVTQQRDYFIGKVLKDSNDTVIGRVDNQNYVITENGSIRLQLNTNDIEHCNYMMWDNAKVGPKGGNTCYAFITDIVLVSANVVEITYSLDVLQTYAVTSEFSGSHKLVDFKECLIERRHVVDDTELHIEPEPLKSDDYFIYNVPDNPNKPFETWDGDYENWKILCYAAVSVGEGSAAPTQGFIAGLCQGIRCTVFDDYDDFIEHFNAQYEQFSQRTVAVVAVPREYPVASKGSLSNASITQEDYEVGKPTSLGNYNKINNKKLLTYPYNMLYVTDYNSKSGEYAFEDFNSAGDTCKFRVYFAYQPNPSALLVPLYYKYPISNTQAQVDVPNFDFGLVMDDFPAIPWTDDAYKRYLGNKDLSRVMATIGGIFGFGNNGVSISQEKLSTTRTEFDPLLGRDVEYNSFRSLTKGLGGKLGGMLKSGPLQGGLKGMLAVEAAQMYQEHRGFPAGVRGDSATALCVANKKTFGFFQKCIRPEVARRFDDYFTEFGYAIGRIHTPNLHNNRLRQHYIKTIGCMVSGNCASSYLRQIESIFDNGVTWWDGSTVQSQNKIGIYQKPATEE